MDKWPDRIYIKQEGISPTTAGVYDAVTGEPILGVMEANIHMSHRGAMLTLTRTTTWPPTRSLDTPPNLSNREWSYEGINVSELSYPIEKLTCEAGFTHDE